VLLLGGVCIKYSELKKILRRAGCCLSREGSRHEVWFNPKTGKYFEVGRHNSHDVKKGTLNSILKDAGIKQGKE